MTTKLDYPVIIKSTTWYPQYQETTESLSNMGGKNFGVTKRTFGISAQSLVDTKVTQLRLMYPDVNNGNVDRNKTWHTFGAADVATKGSASVSYNSVLNNGQSIQLDATGLNITTSDLLASNAKTGMLKNGTYQWFGGQIVTSIPANGTLRFNIINTTGGNLDLTNTVFYTQYFQPVDQVAQNMYNYGARKGTSVFAEFVENGLKLNDVELIFKKLSAIIITNEGGTVEDQNIFADYYDGLNGGSTDMNFGGTGGETIASLRDGISTQAKARLQGNGTPNYYYTNSCFNYRHRMVGGYFDGIRLLTDGAFIYQTVYNVEKTYVALSNRKTAVFGWGALEGVDGWIEAQGTWQRLPFKSPDGDIIRLSRPGGSFELTQAQAFFALLIADTYVMWDDNGQYGTDIKCWHPGYIGGESPDKTKWQPIGGTEVQYTNTPQRVCVEGQAPWSDSAALSHNGAFTAAWLYSRIVNRTTSLKYAQFSYTVNGVSKTGYASSNTPKNGSLGNASVSRRNNGNAGQDNIVGQYEARKPIVMYGSGGNGDVVIILNIWAGLTETIVYNVEGNSITHNGCGLGIYLVGAPTTGGVLPTSFYISQ